MVEAGAAFVAAALAKNGCTASAGGAHPYQHLHGASCGGAPAGGKPPPCGGPAATVAHRKRRAVAAFAMFCGFALALAAVNFTSDHPLVPALSAAGARARFHSKRAGAHTGMRRMGAHAHHSGAAEQQHHHHQPQPRPRRPEERRIALLHKAADPITLRGLQAALRAKRQVEAAGGWYGFVYSLYPHPLPAATGRPASERQRDTLAALQGALGNGTVVPIGMDQVVEVVGEGALERYKELLTGKMRQENWAWSTNDVVDVAWHALHGSSLPSWAQHVWSVELDVAWTGDIVDALVSTVNASGADWVAYATAPAPRSWFWHRCHNWLPRGGVWYSMRHAARYSRRLLDEIARGARSGRVQCDEITAPSVCHANPSWCVVDASWQPGHPVNGADPETGEDLYRWDSLITPERWDAVVAAAEAAAAAAGAPGNRGAAVAVEPRLYHKIKW